MTRRNSFLQGEPSAVTAEEEAYTYILDQIRRGEHHPGDRLKAEEIATQIGMSRMPVREAFRRLSAEGLLIMRPNRGATVCTLTLEDIEEIFEMRAMLEGLAVRLAVPKLDKRAEADLGELLERMERSRHDDEWLTHHRDFHEYVCGLSGRPRLLHQIRSLHTALEPYVRIWFINSDKPISAKVQAEHQEILEAMRRGDPLRTEAVMQEHIQTTAPDLARFLRSRNDKGA